MTTPKLDAPATSPESNGSAVRYWCGVEMSEEYVREWALALGWKSATGCSVHNAINFLKEWGHKITVLAPPNH